MAKCFAGYMAASSAVYKDGARSVYVWLCSCFMHAQPLSEDLFRLLSVPARVQDGATAAAVRISGDG
jgi:hypothetical protein